MGVRIPSKAAKEFGKAVVDRIGPVAYQVADELGLDLAKAGPADAKLVKEVAKHLDNLEPAAQDSLINNVKSYLKHQDDPTHVVGGEVAAEVPQPSAPIGAPKGDTVSAAATQARLNAPPPVDSELKTTFPSGQDAAAGAGKGFSVRAPGSQLQLPEANQGVPQGSPFEPLGAPPPFHDTTIIGKSARTGADIRADLDRPPSTDVNPVTPEYLEPPQSTALARTGQPVQDAELVPDAKAGSTGFAKKVAAGLGVAALAGTGYALSQGSADAPKAAPGAATADVPKPTDGKGAGPAAPPPVTPAGKIDPGFLTTLPSLTSYMKQGPYGSHPGDVKMPGADLKLPDTININGQEVRPIDLMQHAQERLEASLNSLADQYRKEGDALKQREIWEGLVQGIGLIAAGAYGMHNGVDMSGVKFQPTDWVAQQESARRKFDALSGMEKDKYGAAEKTAAVADKDLQQRRTDEEQRWGRNAKIYETAATAYNAEQDAGFKRWQGAVEGVKINNQVAEWKQQMQLGEDRIQGLLDRAVNANEAKHLAKESKQIQLDKAAGVQAQNFMKQAAGAKTTEAGVIAMNQARTIVQDLESRGRAPFPSSVFTDPRGGNSALALRLTDDVPGAASAKTATKQVAAYENSQITGTPTPPPAGMVKMRDPKTGKTGSIPSANVEAAKASGMQVIQ
jgi:hypothetical protein